MYALGIQYRTSGFNHSTAGLNHSMFRDSCSRKPIISTQIGVSTLPNQKFLRFPETPSSASRCPHDQRMRITRASGDTTKTRTSDGQQEEKKGEVLRVAIICGGPSSERGISLNSARSVLDHIQGVEFTVSCFYIDKDLHPYRISNAQMYSNTPEDFDFKLDSLAHGLGSLDEFVKHLSNNVDIVFPVIYGRFGEDGEIQALLEKASIPFIGTGSGACQQSFNKVALA